MVLSKEAETTWEIEGREARPANVPTSGPPGNKFLSDVGYQFSCTGRVARVWENMVLGFGITLEHEHTIK